MEFASTSLSNNFTVNLPKTYEPGLYEADIYKLWEEAGVFQPNSSADDSFTVVAPPPNATGRLHLGHVLGVAISDAIVRFQRMSGKATLYLPGTDHAAIATNAIIERQLKEDGKTKHDIGRDEFIKRVEAFIDTSRGAIGEQFKTVGASMDWSRERYTLEPAMNNVVNKVFEKMYKDGLIYRGSRIVNWDVILQTTVSDDELDYSDEKGKFYTFQYGPFEIGTARPETKFSDKYVVVHPDDERYKDYEHGQKFEAEWINGPVTATVIKDKAADMEFGTGAMTITPWHDQTDFDLAEKYDLDKEPIIGLDGKLLSVAGEFAGMSIEEARDKIAQKLDEKGLLLNVNEKYKHRVARSDRGKGVVEPQIMEQWFIDVNKPVMDWKGEKLSLKQVMQDVVRSGDINIVPERFANTYFSWVDNLRDWCISRQIWFGHQIPAWTNSDGSVHVGAAQPAERGWTRDPDNLDTWFSSALWTFSTLFDKDVAADETKSLDQIIDQSPDFTKFHPTELMENGYDIIFFWDARMIMMTTYITGQIPFKTLYLHGMVQDKDGKKMSKSRPETAVDPSSAVEDFGADALRLSMINGLSPGNNMRLFDDKIRGNRNFCNKLWNIARFIEGISPDNYVPLDIPDIKNSIDAWVVSQLNKAIDSVTKAIDSYQLGRAYDSLYHFVWDDLADWYIEASKTSQNVHTLVYVLDKVLRLTHPFAPFLTETIWQSLNWSDKPLALQDWPEQNRQDSSKSVTDFEQVKAAITEIRRVSVSVKIEDEPLFVPAESSLLSMKEVILQMSPVSKISTEKLEGGLPLISSKGSKLGLSDEKIKGFREVLQVQSDGLDNQIKALQGRLSNEQYVANAPESLVTESRQQLEDLQIQNRTIIEQIERI